MLRIIIMSMMGVLYTEYGNYIEEDDEEEYDDY